MEKVRARPLTPYPDQQRGCRKIYSKTEQSVVFDRPFLPNKGKVAGRLDVQVSELPGPYKRPVFRRPSR